MSARIYDFERAARDAKVRIFVRTIDTYNLTQGNTYLPADVARAAPSWTDEMWTMLAEFASALEGCVVRFPSPIAQAEVIADYEDRAHKLVVAKLLIEQAKMARAVSR